MDATLLIDIEGHPYTVDILSTTASLAPLVQLTRCHPGGYGADLTRQYECSWEAYPDLRETLADGRACSCPDFNRRHRGTGSAGCKHLQALAAVRLLEPMPTCPVALETIDLTGPRDLECDLPATQSGRAAAPQATGPGRAGRVPDGPADYEVAG